MISIDLFIDTSLTLHRLLIQDGKEGGLRKEFVGNLIGG